MTNQKEGMSSAGKAVGPAAAGFVADVIAPGTGSLAGFVSAVALESFDLLRQRLKEREGPLAQEFERALNVIQERSGKSPGDLFAQQAFVTFAVDALRIGMRKHQRETLVRLRVALISAALTENPDHDLQTQFLRLIDDLSERHILLLDVLCTQAEDKIGFIDHIDEIKRTETTLHLTPFTSLQSFYDSLSPAFRSKVSRFHFRLMMSDLSRYFLVYMADAEDLEEFQSGRSGILLESSQTKPVAVTTHGVRFLRFVRGDADD